MSLTPEQIAKRDALVDAYARVGSIEGAARQVGIPGRTAKRWMAPTGTLMPRARQARDAWLAGQSDAHGRQSRALVDAADTAITVLLDQAKGAKSAMARVQAAVAILDRAGHKPVERIDQLVRVEDVERELEGTDLRGLVKAVLGDISATPAAQPEHAAGS